MADMEKYIHEQNLLNYRKQLAETTDAAQRRLLLKVLAEEEAKDSSPVVQISSRGSERS